MQVKDIESNSVEISLCSNWVCSTAANCRLCCMQCQPGATATCVPVMWCQVTTPVLTINNKIRPILDPGGRKFKTRSAIKILWRHSVAYGGANINRKLSTNNDPENFNRYSSHNNIIKQQS